VGADIASRPQLIPPPPLTGDHGNAEIQIPFAGPLFNGGIMKRLIAAIIGASFLLGACSTMEGFGRDVQSGGKKIEHEAAEHK
jgi:predicted small secreted protein